MRLKHSAFSYATAALILGFANSVEAHPHVFVDGGVDFIMSGPGTLTALSVTWLYDDFETLYELSSRGIELLPDGSLTDADRATLRAAHSNWSDDFDGSAHLSIDGRSIETAWPSNLTVDIVDGRLQIKFRRELNEPADLSAKAVEVAFYESTYFFAFKVTNQPVFEGSSTCDAMIISYAPETQSSEVQQSLATLSREETPSIANVGELFADRIVVECA